MWQRNIENKICVICHLEIQKRRSANQKTHVGNCRKTLKRQRINRNVQNFRIRNHIWIKQKRELGITSKISDF